MDVLLDILRGLHPEIDFAANETLVDDGVLNSFDIVYIIAKINEEFDVAVTADEITPDNFNSARALYDLVERLMD